MRVVSGKFKGIKLLEPNLLEVRPTMDRVKTSLFDTLSPFVSGKDVLDLFCGSGSLGIEALSRNAKSCTFCDKSKDSIELTKLNLLKVDKKNESSYTIINAPFQESLISLQANNKKFDLVLLDPPYALETAFDAVKLLFSLDLLKANAIITFETNNKNMEILIANFGKKYRKLKYGNKCVFLIYADNNK